MIKLETYKILLWNGTIEVMKLPLPEAAMFFHEGKAVKRISHDTLRVHSFRSTYRRNRESWLKLKGEDNLNILYKTTPFSGLRTSRESF